MHPTKGAGAGAEKYSEGASADSAGTGGDEEWVQQASWSGATRWRGQVMVGGQEGVPVEARLAPARATRKVQTLGEKAATDESYEGRQMMWKGMAGKSWFERLREWH